MLTISVPQRMQKRLPGCGMRGKRVSNSAGYAGSSLRRVQQRSDLGGLTNHIYRALVRRKLVCLSVRPRNFLAAAPRAIARLTAVSLCILRHIRTSSYPLRALPDVLPRIARLWRERVLVRDKVTRIDAVLSRCGVDVLLAGVAGIGVRTPTKLRARCVVRLRCRNSRRNAALVAAVSACVLAHSQNPLPFVAASPR